MRALAMSVAAVMAASTSVVGLEHGNIPMPRRARSLTKDPEITIDSLNRAVEHREASATVEEAKYAEHQRKIDAANAKRARKAEKLKAAVAVGGIETVVTPVKAEPEPTAPVKAKRSRAKKTKTV